MCDCERTLAARFDESGEVREVWYEMRGGSLAVGEDTSGPVTQAAFGERWRRAIVSLSLEAVESAGLIRESWVGEYFSDGERCLCDLMDALDESGVPYAYTTVGDGGDVAFRPAAV